MSLARYPVPWSRAPDGARHPERRENRVVWQVSLFVPDGWRRGLVGRIADDIVVGVARHRRARER